MTMEDIDLSERSEAEEVATPTFNNANEDKAKAEEHQIQAHSFKTQW